MAQTWSLKHNRAGTYVGKDTADDNLALSLFVAIRGGSAQRETTLDYQNIG